MCSDDESTSGHQVNEVSTTGSLKRQITEDHNHIVDDQAHGIAALADRLLLVNTNVVVGGQ